jgi:hypothetical protein
MVKSKRQRGVYSFSRPLSIDFWEHPLLGREWVVQRPLGKRSVNGDPDHGVRRETGCKVRYSGGRLLEEEKRGPG